MEKTVTPYMLPATEEYLCVLEHLSQEMAAGEFPGICQISSLFLFAYLRKQGIEGRIICGDYEEKGELSPHFWVETEKEIVDGTTVQFKMGTIDKCPAFSSEKKSFFGDNTNEVFQYGQALCKQNGSVYSFKNE